MLRFALVVALTTVTACSAAQESVSAESSQPIISAENEGADAGTRSSEAETSEAATSEAATPGECASSFGDPLTPGFGRIDGIVWAVQKPSDQQCAMPNGDHIIIQVLMHRAVYRLVTTLWLRDNTREISEWSSQSRAL